MHEKPNININRTSRSKTRFTSTSISRSLLSGRGGRRVRHGCQGGRRWHMRRDWSVVWSSWAANIHPHCISLLSFSVIQYLAFRICQFWFIICPFMLSHVSCIIPINHLPFNHVAISFSFLAYQRSFIVWHPGKCWCSNWCWWCIIRWCSNVARRKTRTITLG